MQGTKKFMADFHNLKPTSAAVQQVKKIRTSRHWCNETSMSTTWITITKSDPLYG